ncbi:cobyric acid synthase [Salipaludibacillus daqingensis]|uniref:cobyric acid synthase n=1 Tax=Salipaludibacillus daqingensis TaxID=3041001 RepID=UPI002473DB7D|nr:cobyric acid synthase [Salipaludibacillus daqingensis]
MTKGLPIMIQGTHSDAGKSIICTALCRIFSEKGYKTAPFKSQNMALNSYITVDGKEIGRAQGVQAEAAGVVATTDMNPVLIKPTGEFQSQIVVHGIPYKNMKAGEYRQDFYDEGLKLITESYETLAENYERIVIEGAGSPAEVNLNDRELVNMRVANIANAPVILVGDIDKGGVFASLVGTLQLLEREDRKRVIGVVINKFRGDVKLLEPGLDWFEEYTGLPVLGVVPHIDHLNIEAEDSLALEQYATYKDEEKELDIAVISYPRISNFTDLDPLMREPDCSVRFVRSKKQLGNPDLIILPGSKNTLEDVAFLHGNGLVKKILTLVKENRTLVVGICGGYQMLGNTISDPNAVESGVKSITGLGLIDHLQTTLTEKKRTVLSKGTVTYLGEEIAVSGYEIHMGVSHFSNNDGDSFIDVNDGEEDGFISTNERIIGTYFHGIFENDQFRRLLLNHLREEKGLAPIDHRVEFLALKEEAFQNLAAVVEGHLNVDWIEEKMQTFQEN